MARKPSQRRNYHEEEMELNLTPMMNLIAILIPALLVSTVFVEIAVINVSAPAIGTAPDAEPPKDKPDKPPLNLTVTVTDKGFTLAGSGGVLNTVGADAETKGPTIPIIQKQVSCQRFLGTWPPPRSKNRSQAKCENPEDTRTFWVYDEGSLQKKFLELKDAFPEEKRMIIAAEEDIEFEAIINVMDAGRMVKGEGDEPRELFPEVVLSPGLS
jgi:biopolymer transport protein ExbD